MTRAKSPIAASRAKRKKPASWRSTGRVQVAKNLKRIGSLLGRAPRGGMIDAEGRKLDAESLSADQAVALLEHLHWLNGNMPSERMRLEEVVHPKPMIAWLVEHQAELVKHREVVHDKISASVKRIRHMRDKRYLKAV